MITQSVEMKIFCFLLAEITHLYWGICRWYCLKCNLLCPVSEHSEMIFKFTFTLLVNVVNGGGIKQHCFICLCYLVLEVCERCSTRLWRHIALSPACRTLLPSWMPVSPLLSSSSLSSHAHQCWLGRSLKSSVVDSYHWQSKIGQNKESPGRFF